MSAQPIPQPTTQLQLLEFNRQQASHLRTLTELWNTACGDNLAISTRFVEFNTQPVTAGHQSGRIAQVNGQPIGFVLASSLADASVNAPQVGWVDALAVTPAAQRQGYGTLLLQWAEEWLATQGCQRATLGCSQRPFVPGLPVELATQGFFETHGWLRTNTVWDMAANLAHYSVPSTVREIDGIVRPGQPGDEAALLEFLRREFPGRWRFEFEEFLRNQPRIADYMLLWTERGVDGFCQLTFSDSSRPLDRFFPYQLPRPWGQLGSVGVSADKRGQGYGAAVVDAGLRRLHNNGVNGCVIDWLVIVDFYAKFGFEKSREYTQFGKAL